MCMHGGCSCPVAVSSIISCVYLRDISQHLWGARDLKVSQAWPCSWELTFLGAEWWGCLACSVGGGSRVYLQLQSPGGRWHLPPGHNLWPSWGPSLSGPQPPGRLTAQHLLRAGQGPVLTVTSPTAHGHPEAFLPGPAGWGGETFSFQSWNESLSPATWQHHILKLFCVFLAAFLTCKLNYRSCSG